MAKPIAETAPRGSASTDCRDGDRVAAVGSRMSATGNGARCARITAPDGDAWDYFPHDHARSRAYRWGEDGIAGLGDDQLHLCLALALWNGNDPILKERLFGLTNAEGNHGEDVKELYYYLDGTADPQLHADAVQVSAGGVSLCASRRGKPPPQHGPSRNSSCIDTGVFDDDRYFDVTSNTPRPAPTTSLMR